MESRLTRGPSVGRPERRSGTTNELDQDRVLSELIAQRLTHELELVRRQLTFEVRDGFVHLEIEVLVDADVARIQPLERSARVRTKRGCARWCVQGRLEVGVSSRRSTGLDPRCPTAWLLNSVDAHADLPARVYVVGLCHVGV